MATRAGACVVLLVLVLPAAEASSDTPRTAAAAAGAAPVLPADLAAVENMCALLTSCDRLPLPLGQLPKDFVGCTRALYAEFASASAVSFPLTLRDCGLRATSCAELRTCALRGANAGVCAGRGKPAPVEMCDGDGRAITCNNERISLVRDCPRGGEQCVVREGHAACALGSCDKDAAPTCSRSGTRVLECKHGKLLSLDCGAFGLRCALSDAGPRCATQGAPCTGDSVRCDGATAIACWHHHEVRVDCAARGLSCGGPPDAGASFAPVGACSTAAPTKGACDPAAPATCDGATVRWCAWGSPREYLCTAVGLSRCIADDKGARCGP